MTQSCHWVYDLKFCFLIYKIGKHYTWDSPDIFPGWSKGYSSLQGVVYLRNGGGGVGVGVGPPSLSSPLDLHMQHAGLLFACFGRIYHSH